MADNWLPWGEKTENTFFDLVFFNSDSVPSHSGNKHLAKMYYRIDSDQNNHYRTVFKFMDWLGAIAGIEKFLLKWLTFIFGGFLNYNATIEIIN